MRRIHKLQSAMLIATLVLFNSCNRKASGGDSTGSNTAGDIPKEVRWVSFEELEALQKKAPKKIFIDVYTDWCGWCKKMDASTFNHPVIVKYLSEKFYAVKFNAESKEKISFNGVTYVNPAPDKPRATHQLASSLLNNKLSYPTTVYIDEEMKMLGPVAGYLDARTFEAILHYYGDEAYKTTPWPSYFDSFKGEIQ